MNNIIHELDKARDYPRNTCGASRHAAQIAVALIQHGRCHALTDDPEHAGESIAGTVAALWTARTDLAKLQGERAVLAGLLAECDCVLATIEPESSEEASSLDYLRRGIADALTGAKGELL